MNNRNSSRFRRRSAKNGVGFFGAQFRRLKRWLRRGEVLLVTDAQVSPSQNRRRRTIIYNILQGLRIPLLLFSGISYVLWHNWILPVLLFVLSVPLPWVAVVIANGHGQPRDPRTRNVYKPGVMRELQQQKILGEAYRRQLPEENPPELEEQRTSKDRIIDNDSE